MKIVDVIKYEGDNTTFIWKHPAEDFNTMSQLIVHESQEALLFMNGQALDLFKAGRHTLHTQNIPLLRSLVNLPTDGVSPFHCEVYFINKAEQMAINWGIGDVKFMDPTNNDYPFTIGANGEMSLKVEDSRKLITKLVGTTEVLNQETVKKFFKSPISMHIKTMLPNILRERKNSIFDVENDLSGLSEILKKRVSDEMADYGISLEKFWIIGVRKPEDDPVYKRLMQQRGDWATIDTQGELDKKRAAYAAQVSVIAHGGEVEKKKMDVDIKAYEQRVRGFTYQQERGFDVMQAAAENEGSGSDLRNAAMGVGMGFGIGGAFGHAMGDIANSSGFSGLMQTPDAAPQQPAAPQQTGAPAGSDPLAEFQARLQKLEMMKGILSPEEYEAKRQELIESI